jgi:glycine/D-amino acid oxidase-like deaminating enzyme
VSEFEQRGGLGWVKDAGQTSLWEATATAAKHRPPLSGAQRAQVTVIGAGYTGLSAALHLAEMGMDVAVIDAHEPGWGASGRNGGQVIAGVKHDPDKLEKLFGKRGATIVKTVGAAPDLVFDLISRYQIRCDALRTGWLQLAVTEATLKQVAERARQWQARGAPVRVLNRAEACALSGSMVYLGGLLDARGGTVQPLSYARGLAAAAEGLGARIFHATPCTRLSRASYGWFVETQSGSLASRAVIMATNAYGGPLWPELWRSVVPVPSFQIASEPMPQALREMILPERQPVSDTRRLLRYFRLDEEGRLVMGTRGYFGRVTPEQAARHHLAAVREVFPSAAGLAFPYQWGGNVAMTPDHLPHLHELAPGLLAGLGYNGRGVAMATMMGRILATWASGTHWENLPFPVTSVSPMGLHQFARMGARLAIQYWRLRDGMDRR